MLLGCSLLVVLAWYVLVTPERVATSLMVPGTHPQNVNRPHTGEMDSEAFTVETRDGISLRAWFIPAQTDAVKSIVVCHGVGADHWGAVGLAQALHQADDVDVVLFDFRGHGLSQDAPYTYGGHETLDVEAVVEWTRARSGRPVSLVGWSAGAAIALMYASTDPQIRSVVAINAFADMSEMAEYRKPFFVSSSVYEEALRIVQQRAQFRMSDVSPIHQANTLSMPVLLIVGQEDTTIPPSHSQRLHESIPDSELWVLRGIGHDDWWMHPAFNDRIRDFLQMASN